MPSGTVTIATPGTTTATVLGAFGSFDPLNPTGNYQVSVSTSWATDVLIVSKTATQFVIGFTVGSFPANATFDWFVSGVIAQPGGFSSLQDYLDDTRRLLRDESSQGNPLYSTADLTSYINRAIRQRDLMTGLNRVLVSFALTPNTFQYAISTVLEQGTIQASSQTPTSSFTQAVPFGAGGMTFSGSFLPGYTVLQPGTNWPTVAAVINQTPTSFEVVFTIPAPVGAQVDIIIEGVGGVPTPNVIDVLSITITPLGQPPGGIRYPLARWPYSRLAYLLTTSYPTYPSAYAAFGVGTIMIGPPPANAYPAQWDFFGYSSPLVQAIDTDPMPYPWTDPIPWLAAYYAKFGVQRFDEAKEFKGEADYRMRQVIGRGRPISVKSPWSDLPTSAR